MIAEQALMSLELVLKIFILVPIPIIAKWISNNHMNRKFFEGKNKTSFIK